MHRSTGRWDVDLANRWRRCPSLPVAPTSWSSCISDTGCVGQLRNCVDHGPADGAMRYDGRLRDAWGSGCGESRRTADDRQYPRLHAFPVGSTVGAVLPLDGDHGDAVIASGPFAQ